MLEALLERAPLARVGEAEAACERRRGPLGGAALAENAGQVLAERDRRAIMSEMAVVVKANSERMARDAARG